NRSYMIQRIQTLYLLLVVVLTGLALWLPLADFTVGADTCTLTAFGLKDAAGITLLPTVYLGVVLVAACLVPLVTIFLFKRRLVQIRLCAVELVLLIGAGAMMGIYFYLCNRYFADSEFYSHTLKISLVFPLVCLVFRLAGFAGDLPGEKAGAVARPDSLTGRISRKKGVRSKLHAFCVYFAGKEYGLVGFLIRNKNPVCRYI
ncbi:conserved hypothetical protein, membrane, partial [human gut metagenome]